MSSLTTLIQHGDGSFSQYNSTVKKRIKSIHIEKGKKKLPFWWFVVFVENGKELTKIKTLRSNKWVYQSLRIEYQHTEINLNFTY